MMKCWSTIPARGDVTRDEWDGEEGWPFGAVPGSEDATYLSQIVNLGSLKTGEAMPEIDFLAPPGPAVAADESATLTLLHGIAEDAVTTEITLAEDVWTAFPVAQYLRLKLQLDTGFQGQGISGLALGYRVAA